MRILLDESVPVQLRTQLPGHDVWTVSYLGWDGKQNGELLELARGEFDTLITADQKMEYQQNLGGTDVAIIVLVARSNSREYLEPLMPAVLEFLTITDLRPGEFYRIEARYA